MAVLQLGERKPSPSEEKYLAAWVDMGFPAETWYCFIQSFLPPDGFSSFFGAGFFCPGSAGVWRYVWARKGLLSSTSANDYLNALHAREQKYPAYMAVLQLGERKPSPSEEKYLHGGQPPRAVLRGVAGDAVVDEEKEHVGGQAEVLVKPEELADGRRRERAELALDLAQKRGKARRSAGSSGFARPAACPPACSFSSSPTASPATPRSTAARGACRRTA